MANLRTTFLPDEGLIWSHYRQWYHFLSRCFFVLMVICFVFSPKLGETREREFLLETLVEARAETEARTLKSEDGTPFCFPPSEMLAGTEAHVVQAARGFGGGDYEEDELSGYVDVYVKGTEAPILLILRANDAVIWRIFASSDAEIRAVHLMSIYQSFVTGVPTGVPVTSRFRRPFAEGEAEDCVFSNPGPEETLHVMPRGNEGAHGAYNDVWFANFSAGGRLSQSKAWRSLRLKLDAYAGIAIASIAKFSGVTAYGVNVSKRSAAKFDAIRQRGRDWLAANRPPQLGHILPDAEVLAAPDGVSGFAAMQWFTSAGYAERTSHDQVEYLCGRDLALAISEGDDLFWDWHIQDCWARQNASRMFTVLGPIKLTEEICASRDRPALLIPEGMEVDWFPTCGWARFEYPNP